MIYSFFSSHSEYLHQISNGLHAADKYILDAARMRLGYAFLTFLQMLVGAVDMLPSDLKKQVCFLYEVVKSKYGEEIAHHFIVRQFFLQYLCPVLANPAVLNVEISDSLKKLTRHLLSRLLLAAASRECFETENMKFANQFLGEAQQLIDLFVFDLCSVPLSNVFNQLKMSCFLEFGKHYQVPFFFNVN